MIKKLFIITNERIYENNGNFFCDNIDSKSTPESLNKNFEVNVISRRSNKKRAHQINLKKIKTYKSFFLFLCSILSSTKESDAKFLIVSITPYTFFASLILKLFKKTPFIYLRSDGYKEYEIILGSLGKLLYHFMFSVVASYSSLISCREQILNGKKGYVVSPSKIDENWFINTKKNPLDDFKLLYVGRIKKEKGIFSLIKMIKDKDDIFLTIVGSEYENRSSIAQSNIKVFKNITDLKVLINFYDKNNVFILPSFTEGHPMVLLEALARKRPVIIFKEIDHVVGKKKGIFVSERNYESLHRTLKKIKENYNAIVEEMTQNILPTRKEFDEAINKIIDSK